MAATARIACTCSTVFATDAEGNELSTGCTATTTRTFAPGHDARLKGFLIRHGAAGDEVSINEGGMLISSDAEGVANRFGFAHQVRAGIKRAIAKAAARRARKTAPKPVIVTAKVGRWVYSGVVEGAEFVYTDKRGNAVRTVKFTVQG